MALPCVQETAQVSACLAPQVVPDTASELILTAGSQSPNASPQSEWEILRVG